MSKAHRVRKLIDYAGMAIALGTMFELRDFWVGLLAASAVFLITHAFAQAAFVALASPDEMREDMRNRNDGGF